MGAESRWRPRREVAGGHGTRNAEALRNLATETKQENSLLHGFDSFSDGEAAKCSCQTKHPFDDGEVFRIVEHIADESLVDLEHVDRQPLQKGERGVAGAEVIESERDAEFAAGVNDLRDLCHVGQGAALKHFDFEAGRINGGVGGEQSCRRAGKSGCCNCCAEILTLTGILRPREPRFPSA